MMEILRLSLYELPFESSCGLGNSGGNRNLRPSLLDG